MRWFRSVRILFAPVSVAGWVITALWAAFCVNVFVVVDGRSHSASDTLYGIFPYVVPAFLLLAWIAGRTGAGITERA